MAKSRTYYFKGKIHWAKVFESNRDMNGYKGAAKEFGGEYSVTLVGMDKDTKAAIKATGMQKKIQVDDDKYDGRPFITFTRKHENKGKGGEIVEEWSGAPQVFDDEGSAWDTDVLIGNDSDGVVKITVYNTTDGKGTRLESLMITELIEYEGSGDDEDDGVDDSDNPSASSNYDGLPF